MNGKTVIGGGGRWARIAAALALAVTAGGCLIRDGGASEDAIGVVRDDALCAGCSARWYGRAPAGADRDLDGVDDALEREVAERNFPALLAAPGEPCGDPAGVLYRVRRHPQAPARLAVTYVVLYRRDCGALGDHVGDSEAFALTVDLDARPGAPATVGVAAEAHGGTLCASHSTCQTAAGTGACASPTGPGREPEVTLYAARGGHALYLAEATCHHNCLDRCGAGRRMTDLPQVNAGEPEHPLVTDLSVGDGFVRAEAGWAGDLLHADPWGKRGFGGAAPLRSQLEELIAPPGR